MGKFLRLLIALAGLALLLNIPAKKSLVQNKEEHISYSNLCSDKNVFSVDSIQKKNQNKALFVSCGGFI